MTPTLRPIPRIIFMSRWLQLPLEKTMFYQTAIHITFLLCAMAIAAVDRILRPAAGKGPSQLPLNAPAGLRDEH